MARKCPKCGTSFADTVFFCGHDGVITIQEQPVEDVDPRLGQKLGAYIVAARVADGAMGRVYEGRHPETKARTAIKVLHDHVARDAIAVERFKREYETAEQLNHPYVVKVLEFGTTPDGSRFLTMEFLEGEELGQLLRRDGKLAVVRAIRILCQTALALDHAHSFGVIHRDLKPDNVFLSRSPVGDVVRVLDFGSVKLQMETGPKLTALGTTLGSPYYMSPEQAMGKSDVDPRTDQFALAAILFEMLTGKIAFDGGSVGEILMKIVSATPPDASLFQPSLPKAIDDVIAKGVRKDKTKRYASTRELADATCSAFGLGPTAERWAQAPLADLAAALAAASPPAAKPFGAVSQPPAPVARAQVDTAPQRAPRLSPSMAGCEKAVPAGLPGAGPSQVLLIGLVVVGLALLCVVAYWLFG